MKDSLFLEICRNEYRAIFQMLRNAIELCSDSLWDDRSEGTAFWLQACHTIFFIDFYLSDSPESFHEPPSFVEYKLDKTPGDAPFQKQIVNYLEQVSSRCEMVLNKISPNQLEGKNTFSWTGPTLAHRLVYNIRHAQHHVGWLNSILSRKAGQAADWVITTQ